MASDLKTIINIIDRTSPFSLAEDWDNSGIQVNSGSRLINRILVALDPTIEAVKKAVSVNAELLLTHHPLIFRKLSCIDTDEYPGDVIKESIKNDISIVSFHTNLDSAATGLNHILAEKLGLENIEVLQQKDGPFADSGLGRIGDLPEEENFFDLAARIKEIFNISGLKVSGPGDRLIKRAAVVGGSGGDMIKAAAEKGADLLITGDISHHDALTAGSCNINIIDAGHFNTEKTALNAYTHKLEEVFKDHDMDIDITIEIFDEETDPMREM